MEAGLPPSVAKPAASLPLRPGVGLVAGARLPLAFICTGLGALVLAVAIQALRPELLLLPYLHPQVVAVAHLWLPGFLLSVTLGAVYQLMPVVLGSPLRLPFAAAWWHYALHSGGAGLLVAGFFAGRFELVAIGGTAVASGVSILLVGTWRTFLAASRRDAVAWSFPVSTSWLAATVFAGVVLALNRRDPFLPLSVVDLLRAHAHLGLGGFFLTLLQGATFQLVPMFTMADLRRAGWVRAGLWFSQAGMLLLAPGLACGQGTAALAGALLVGAGVGSSGVALIATLRSRRRKALEPGVRAFVVGAGILALAAVGGVVLLALPASASSFAARGTIAYGITVGVGALSFMILGMLCKIVPFLVWMKTYGPLAGRRKVPLATALGSRTLENCWMALHAAALLTLIVAILVGSPGLLAIGSAMLAVAILVFITNVVRVLCHLGEPEPVVDPHSGMAASPS